jgi:endonuclease/exonuclease/phosphatase family metal-dependent hydrolase
MKRRTFLKAAGLAGVGSFFSLPLLDWRVRQVLYTNLIAEPANLENNLEAMIRKGSFLKKPEKMGDELSITTYNIQLGQNAGIEDDIRSLDSDILLLQEVPELKGKKRFYEEIGRGMGMDYAYAPSNIKMVENKIEGMNGLLTLSKYPIIDSEIIRLPQGYDWENWTRKGGPIALRTDIESPKGEISVYSTHLDNRTSPSFRAKQMGIILAKVPKERRVIIGGDLNVVFESIWYSEPTINVLKNEGFIEPEIAGRSYRLKYWPISRAAGFDTRLDRIFAKGFQAISGKVRFDCKGSDHYPVEVILAI